MIAQKSECRFTFAILEEGCQDCIDAACGPFQGGINPSVQRYLLLTGEEKRIYKKGLVMNTISLIFLFSDLPVLFALYGFI